MKQRTKGLMAFAEANLPHASRLEVFTAKADCRVALFLVRHHLEGVEFPAISEEKQEFTKVT
jgi:hypothetical protein